MKNYMEKRVPQAKNLVGIFEGSWKTDVIPNLVGSQNFSERDSRVSFVAANMAGGLAGKRILELGPFENYNTRQFVSMGAGHVTTVEASSANFVKGLLVNAIHDLHESVHPLFGDALEYLTTSEDHFDLIHASGILYHLSKPLELIEMMSKHADNIYIWTHFFLRRSLT